MQLNNRIKSKIANVQPHGQTGGGVVKPQTGSNFNFDMQSMFPTVSQIMNTGGGQPTDVQIPMPRETNVQKPEVPQIANGFYQLSPQYRQMLQNRGNV